MPSFTPKILPRPDDLGEKLRQARLFKNWRIEDIAKKIKIRPEYLIALEEERFENLPAGLYGKNFLKKYVRSLGLDQATFAPYWNRLGGDGLDDPFSQKIVKKNKFFIFPKLFRNALAIAAIIICFLYLIFYFKKIIFAPTLIILQPDKNLATKEMTITVIGQTEKEAEVKINGELILNNHNGAFSQTINLKRGLNNIIIKAKKKYSRENTATRQILVEQ